MADHHAARAASATPDLLYAAPWAPYLEGWLQAQRDQLESAILWQQSFVALYRELWDRWIAHCAGGAPIDV